MQREFVLKIPSALLLPLFLLIGCGDDKALPEVQEQPRAGRLFDSQRSALEVAKETAGSAIQRNEYFLEKAKGTD